MADRQEPDPRSRGPLDEGREVLLAVPAPSEEAVRERLAADIWHQNGMLRISSIEAWSILLEGRNSSRRPVHDGSQLQIPQLFA